MATSRIKLQDVILLVTENIDLKIECLSSRKSVLAPFKFIEQNIKNQSFVIYALQNLFQFKIHRNLRRN